MLEVNERFLAPDLLSEFFPSDQLPGTGGEQDQDSRGLGRKFDVHPAFPQFPALDV